MNHAYASIVTARSHPRCRSFLVPLPTGDPGPHSRPPGGSGRFGAYAFYQVRRGANASAHLAAAKSSSDYQEIIAQYGSTPAGASASLLLAEAQRKDRKFAESNATLQSFIDKNSEHELVPTAKMAMASNLESMGKTDEALSLYQLMATKYSKAFTAPLALMSQVRIFKAKNQNDQARRVCETVLSQYGESFWAGEAMRELRSLKPTPSASPATAGGSPGAPSVSPAQVLQPPTPPGAVPGGPPKASAPPKKKK